MACYLLELNLVVWFVFTRLSAGPIVQGATLCGCFTLFDERLCGVDSALPRMDESFRLCEIQTILHGAIIGHSGRAYVVRGAVWRAHRSQLNTQGGKEIVERGQRLYALVHLLDLSKSPTHLASTRLDMCEPDRSQQRPPKPIQSSQRRGPTTPVSDAPSTHEHHRIDHPLAFHYTEHASTRPPLPAVLAPLHDRKVVRPVEPRTTGLDHHTPPRCDGVRTVLVLAVLFLAVPPGPLLALAAHVDPTRPAILARVAPQRTFRLIRRLRAVDVPDKRRPTVSDLL